MIVFFRLLTILIISISFNSSCFSYGKYGNIKINDAIIQRIQDGGQEYISDKKVSKTSDKPLSIIWVQKDYLTALFLYPL